MRVDCRKKVHSISNNCLAYIAVPLANFRASLKEEEALTFQAFIEGTYNLETIYVSEYYAGRLFSAIMCLVVQSVPFYRKLGKNTMSSVPNNTLFKR